MNRTEDPEIKPHSYGHLILTKIPIDTLNLIEEKVGKSLEFIGTGGNFLNRTPMAHSLKSRIDKWDLVKLESFCKAKDIANKTNGNLQIGKNLH